MKVKDAQFFTVVSSFLNVYLVKNRSCSSNTVKSYEDALNLLFTFLEGTKDIPRQRVNWSHFTRQNIQEFVDWLEKVRNWFFLFHFSLIWCVWIWARSRERSRLKMFILDVKIRKQRFRR